MINKKLVTTLLIVTLSLITSSAFAVKFSDFYYVGDSLTDIGNNPDYVNHRQPGGINWSQFLAGKFGQGISNSDKGGHNYAYVGAKSDDVHGALSQTTQLLADHPRLDNKALYSLWIGANDLMSVLKPAPQPLPVIFGTINNCAANIATILTQMHNAGARYFLVGNMPNLGDTAEGYTKDPLTRLFLKFLAQSMNNSIRTAVNQLPFDVIQVDDFGLLNAVNAHPAEYGFIHVGDKMCKGSGDPNCKGYLFWDEIHPSQQGHSMLADYDYSILAAPDYYAYLAESPFSSIKTQHQNIKNEIRQQSILETLANPHFFIDGNYSPYRSAANNSDRVNNKTNSGAGTLGVLYPVTNKVVIGGTFGYSQDFTKLSGDVFEYHANASNIALFTDYHPSQFYITGTVNGGYLHYTDIKRSAMIGIKQILTNGDTTGWNLGGAIDGGYDIVLPGNIWTTGPIADLAYQRIYVDGYMETGNAEETFAQLEFSNQHNDSFTTALGWEFNFKKPVNANVFSGTIFATGNREWLNGDRDIGFHVVSIPGSHATLPVGTPSDYFFNAGFNCGWTFGKVYTLSLGYNGIFGKDRLQEHNVNLGLSIAM